MKRLIFGLILIITFCIGAVNNCFAFDVGDKIDGITVSSVDSTVLSFDKYIVVNGTLYLFSSDTCYYDGSSTIYFGSSVYYLSYNSFSSGGKINGGGYGVKTCDSVKLSDITASNFDLKDNNGNVVFPPPPPEEIPEGTIPGLEGITAELLLAVLREMKPILLGLAVSVIGFLAFRKAWIWVLASFRSS